MYIVGQNNPNVGNDRRQQLLQQLVQQAAQKAGGIQQTGDQGFSSLQQLIADRRRQQMHTPSSPTRAAGAGRPTAGTSLLNASPLPTGIAARMGIGGNSGNFGGGVSTMPSRVSGGAHLNPGAGIPPHLPGPSGILPQPQSPAAQNLGTAMQDARFPAPPGQEAPTQSTAPNGQVFNMTTLVPLGGGMFLDPNTGMIRGGGALPMGGATRLVGPDARM